MSSINDLAEKVKSKLAPFYALILLVLVALIFFALGRLSTVEEKHEPIRVLQGSAAEVASPLAATNAGIAPAGNAQSEGSVGTGMTTSASGRVIGSKNSKKYYFPWCGAVKNINTENQVSFASADSARQAGYVPGGNCKGLK
jgi:hypothetical protein